MSFYVGQKIICINDDPYFCNQGVLTDLNGLKRGRIYTVRQVTGCPFGSGEPCIRVNEIVRPAHYESKYNDMPYLAKRFETAPDRTVERSTDRKTSIDVFKKMLNVGGN